jgi:hypothetical protein
MAGQAPAYVIGRADLARPLPRRRPWHARECDVVRRYEPVFINDAVASGQDTDVHGIWPEGLSEQSYSVHCANMLLSCVHERGGTHMVAQICFAALQALGIPEVGQLECPRSADSFAARTTGDD